MRRLCFVALLISLPITLLTTECCAQTTLTASSDARESVPAWEQKLLQQLGLSEEDGCFKPHENLRPVRTASSEQVRQALYTDAIDYWQRFDQHLDPLRQALSVIPSR